MISIHTTTQVVTASLKACSIYIDNFNPHHHAGGDGRPCTDSVPPTDFNPHHHAGGDYSRLSLTHAESDFNPHHHAGGDQ